MGGAVDVHERPRGALKRRASFSAAEQQRWVGGWVVLVLWVLLLWVGVPLSVTHGLPRGLIRCLGNRCTIHHLRVLRRNTSRTSQPTILPLPHTPTDELVSYLGGDL
jgi:hypothetical protein